MGLEDDPFFPFGVSVCLAFFSGVLLLNCRGVKKNGESGKKHHHHGNLFFFLLACSRQLFVFGMLVKGGNMHRKSCLWPGSYTGMESLGDLFLDSLNQTQPTTNHCES